MPKDSLKNVPQPAQPKPELNNAKVPQATSQALDAERRSAAGTERTAPPKLNGTGASSSPNQRQLEFQLQSQRDLQAVTKPHQENTLEPLLASLETDLKRSFQPLELEQLYRQQAKETPRSNAEPPGQNPPSLPSPAQTSHAEQPAPAAKTAFDAASLPETLKKIAAEYAACGADYACFGGKYWAMQRGYSDYMPFITAGLAELDAACPELMADPALRQTICAIRSETAVNRLAAEVQQLSRLREARLNYLSQQGLKLAPQGNNAEPQIELQKDTQLHDLLQVLAWGTQQQELLTRHTPKYQPPSLTTRLFPQQMPDTGGELSPELFAELYESVQKSRASGGFTSEDQTQDIVKRLWNIKLSNQQFESLSQMLFPPLFRLQASLSSTVPHGLRSQPNPSSLEPALSLGRPDTLTLGSASPRLELTQGAIKLDYALLKHLESEGQKVLDYYQGANTHLRRANPELFSQLDAAQPQFLTFLSPAALTAALAGAASDVEGTPLFYCLQRDLQHWSRGISQRSAIAFPTLSAPSNTMPHIGEVSTATQVGINLAQIPNHFMPADTRLNLSETEFGTALRLEELVCLKKTIELVLHSKEAFKNETPLPKAYIDCLYELHQSVSESLLALGSKEAPSIKEIEASSFDNPLKQALLAALKDPHLLEALGNTAEESQTPILVVKHLLSYLQGAIPASFDHPAEKQEGQEAQSSVLHLADMLRHFDLHTSDFAEFISLLHQGEDLLGLTPELNQEQAGQERSLLYGSAQDALLAGLKRAVCQPWRAFYQDGQISCQWESPSCLWQIQNFLELPLAELQAKYGLLVQGDTFLRELSILRHEYKEKSLALAVENYSRSTDHKRDKLFFEAGLQPAIITLPDTHLAEGGLLPGGQIFAVRLTKPIALDQLIKHLYQANQGYRFVPSELHYRLLLQDNPDLAEITSQAQKLGADEVILPEGSLLAIQMTPLALEMQERLLSEMLLQQQLVRLRLESTPDIEEEVLKHAESDEEGLKSELSHLRSRQMLAGFLTELANTESLSMSGQLPGEKAYTKAPDHAIWRRLDELREKLCELTQNPALSPLAAELGIELLMSRARCAYRLGGANFENQRPLEAKKTYDLGLAAVAELLSPANRENLPREQVLALFELRANFYRHKAQTSLALPEVKRIASYDDWSKLSAADRKFILDSEIEILNCYNGAISSWESVRLWSLSDRRLYQAAETRVQDLEAEKIAVMAEFYGRMRNAWSEQLWLIMQADLLLGYDPSATDTKNQSPLRLVFDSPSHAAQKTRFQETSGAKASGSEWFWQTETHLVFGPQQLGEITERFKRLSPARQEQFLELMPRLAASALGRLDPKAGLGHALCYRQVMEHLLATEQFRRLPSQTQKDLKLLHQITDAQVRFHFANVHDEQSARGSAISVIRQARLQAEQDLSADSTAQKFASLHRTMQQSASPAERTRLQDQIIQLQNHYARHQALIERAFNLELQLQIMTLQYEPGAYKQAAALCREGEAKELEAIAELTRQIEALQSKQPEDQDSNTADLIDKGIDKLQHDVQARQANCVALRLQEALVCLQAGYGKDAKDILLQLKQDYGGVPLGDQTVAQKVDQILNEHDTGALTAWVQRSMNELARPTFGVWGDSLSILGCGAAGAGIACFFGPEAAPLGFIIGTGAGLVILKVYNVADGGWVRAGQAWDSGLSILPASQTFWDSVIVGVDALTLAAGVKGGSLLVKALGKASLEQAAEELIKHSAGSLSRREALNLAKRQAYLSASREASSFGARTVAVLSGAGIAGPLVWHTYSIAVDPDLSNQEKIRRLKEAGAQAGQAALIVGMFLTAHYATNRLSNKLSTARWTKELEAKYRASSAKPNLDPPLLAQSDLPPATVNLEPVRRGIQRTYALLQDGLKRSKEAGPKPRKPAPDMPPAGETATPPKQPPRRTKPETPPPAREIRIEDLPASRQAPIREQQALLQRLTADLNNPRFADARSHIEKFIADAAEKLRQMKEDAWKVVQNERQRTVSKQPPGPEPPALDGGFGGEGLGPKPKPGGKANPLPKDTGSHPGHDLFGFNQTLDWLSTTPRRTSPPSSGASGRDISLTIAPKPRPAKTPSHTASTLDAPNTAAQTKPHTEVKPQANAQPKNISRAPEARVKTTLEEVSPVKPFESAPALQSATAVLEAPPGIKIPAQPAPPSPGPAYGRWSNQTVEALAKLNRQAMELRRRLRSLSDPKGRAALQEKLELLSREMQKLRDSKPSAPALEAPASKPLLETPSITPRDLAALKAQVDPWISKARLLLTPQKSVRAIAPAAQTLGQSTLQEPSHTVLPEAPLPSASPEPSAPQTASAENGWPPQLLEALTNLHSKAMGLRRQLRVLVDPAERAVLRQRLTAFNQDMLRLEEQGQSPTASGAPAPELISKNPNTPAFDLSSLREYAQQLIPKARSFLRVLLEQPPATEIRAETEPPEIEPPPSSDAQPRLVQAEPSPAPYWETNTPFSAPETPPRLIADPAISAIQPEIEPRVDTISQPQTSEKLAAQPFSHPEAELMAIRLMTETKKRGRKKDEDLIPYYGGINEEKKKKEKREEEPAHRPTPPLFDQWLLPSRAGRRHALIRQYLRRRTRPRIGAETYQRGIERLMGDLYHYELDEEEAD